MDVDGKVKFGQINCDQDKDSVKSLMLVTIHI